MFGNNSAMYKCLFNILKVKQLQEMFSPGLFNHIYKPEGEHLEVRKQIFGRWQSFC